jgi:hypothetical protein
MVAEEDVNSIDPTGYNNEVLLIVIEQRCSVLVSQVKSQ